MLKQKTILIFVIFSYLFFGGNIFSQTKKIDSLKSILKTELDDTTMLNNLILVNEEFKNGGNYHEAIKYTKEFLSEHEKQIKKIAGDQTSKIIQKKLIQFYFNFDGNYYKYDN